jgi:uncharacterized protein (UPF0335 family)
MRLAVRVETQNFYIELADKKINEWIESYEIKEPIEFKFKFEFITTQIKRVVTEITEYFTQQIESELGDWQSQQLEPIIKQRLENLRLELDTKATDFIKNVDNLRLQIAPDSFDTSTIFDPEKKVSAVERIIATAGGFVIGGLGSAAVGAVFGYQEMLKSILPQLGLAIGAIILGFTSPWVLIPLLMGGGLVQGILKMKATNNQVKQTVAKEYIKQIRHSNYQQSDKIAGSVVEKLRDFQNKIDQGLEKEIQSIRDQVNSVLEEKQMNQLDSKLDEFIAKIALG